AMDVDDGLRGLRTKRGRRVVDAELMDVQPDIGLGTKRSAAGTSLASCSTDPSRALRGLRRARSTSHGLCSYKLHIRKLLCIVAKVNGGSWRQGRLRWHGMASLENCSRPMHSKTTSARSRSAHGVRALSSCTTPACRTRTPGTAGKRARRRLPM